MPTAAETMPTATEEGSRIPALGPLDEFAARPTALASFGDHALVGAGRRVLVYDMRGPGSPRLVGRSPLLGSRISALAVDEGLVFAGGTDYMAVLDLRGSADPQPIWQNRAPIEQIKHLDVDGDRLFVFSGFRPLVYDIAYPRRPRELTVDLPENYQIYEAEDLSASAGQALIAGGEQGLWRVAPVRDHRSYALTQISESRSHAVRLHGRTAYVAAGARGLKVLRITDSGLPEELSTALAGVGVERLGRVGSQLYVSGGYPRGDTLWSLDLSDPLRPGAPKGLNLPGRPGRISEAEGRLSIIGLLPWHGLMGLDLTRPDSPAPSPVLAIGSEPKAMVLEDGSEPELAYVVDSGERLQAYRLGPTGPDGHALLGWTDLPDRIDIDPGTPMASGSGYLFLGSGAELLLYDMRSPELPMRQGRLDLSAEIARIDRIEIEGRWAFLFGEQPGPSQSPSAIGLWAVDWSDPRRPMLRGSALAPAKLSPPSSGGAYSQGIVDLDRYGDWALGSAWELREKAGQEIRLGRLLLFDLRQPAAPRILADQDLPEITPLGLGHERSLFALSFSRPDPNGLPGDELHGFSLYRAGEFGLNQLMSQAMPCAGSLEVVEAWAYMSCFIGQGPNSETSIRAIDLADPLVPATRYQFPDTGFSGAAASAPGADRVYATDGWSGVAAFRAPPRFRALLPLLFERR